MFRPRFVDEDFEDGIPGELVTGGCWRCDTGACYETWSDAAAYSGLQSLYTAPDLVRANTAQLYCVDPGFAADFSFSSWFYDDYPDGHEMRVLFSSAVTYAASSDVLRVGYATPHYACTADRYCVEDGQQIVELGPRSAGWQSITVEARYSSTTTIDWQACVNGSCAELSTSGAAVASFRLHHDATLSYMDDFLACPN